MASPWQLAVQPHSAFEFVREVALPNFRATFVEYRHRVTGARHLHIGCDNSENVFLVAFKTMPDNSSGVAHVLEHTALCGSRRFPVRDPFFLMIRRSLNTFMNAFTASDWTAYPFASTNSQDFDNLLQVYLDAAFFPELNPLDFAQEGIRREVVGEGDAAHLEYKGVVFNEMKGAMSSAHSVLHETLNRFLFPTTTYHHNSGGDPEHIPDLTHADLLTFHRQHYHPSNAIFMTFGNAQPAALQARFQELALQHFTGTAAPVLGRDEKRYAAPLRVQTAYAPESDEGPQTHHVMGWLLGPSSDARARFEAHLLSGVLLENSASPLRAALETTSLGQAPSALCGLDDHGREMTFVCGIEGAEKHTADEVEQLIMDTLSRVVRDGVDQAQVEAVLHQFELSQREIGGDSYPYGLQLLLNGLSPALQDADPVAVWDIEAELARLRAAIQSPTFTADLVQRLLLDNPHRVRLTLQPDDDFAARRDGIEQAKLAAEFAALTAEQRSALQQQTADLLARQAAPVDADVLPKVSLADVPVAVKQLQGEEAARTIVQPTHLPLTQYQQGTNGLFYQQLVVELPALDDELLPLLPLYAALFSELGAGADDYLTMQQRQSAVSGGLRMTVSARSDRLDAGQAQAHLIVAGKALAHQQQAFQQLMLDTLHGLRFDETDRIRDVLAQMKARWDASITGQGHALAMAYASQCCSALVQQQQRYSGLPGIRYLRQLSSQLDLVALSAKLVHIHQAVCQSARQLLQVGELTTLAEAAETAAGLWLPVEQPVPTWSWQLPSRQPVQAAWLLQTQVQFCARVFPAVPSGHPDAPALMALGGILRNGYLHRAIREQGGAYGGGAGYDGNACAFRFYSYRDPRLTATLNDFDASIDWLLSGQASTSALEEAQLALFADMDKPLSPAGEAKQDFYQRLYGRLPSHRQALREALLNLTLADVERVAAHYLKPDFANTAVIAPTNKQSEVEQLGLTVERMSL